MTANKPYNEKELVEKLAQGDEMAFREIFYTHHQRIGAFVLHITGAGPAVEELVQDIFMKLWLHRQKLHNVEQFTAYLYAIARNHMYTYLKKQGRELARKHQWEAEAPVQLTTWQHSTDDYYKNLLDYAIGQLPAQQQKVYLLSRDEGLPHDGIAKKLGVSLETVKKHMVLALRSIRQKIAENKDKVISRILFFF